jgi:hypothetical protein
MSLVSGMALGAAVMYVLDPDQGRTRRALARDKVVRALRVLRERGSNRLKDVRNRLYGSIAEFRSTLRDSSAQLPDHVIERRVRAQIGHVLSHPGSVELHVRNGQAIITGPVLRGEIEKLMHRLDKTRGIRRYELHLEEHDDPNSIPELQGESRWQRKQRTAL